MTEPSPTDPQLIAQIDASWRAPAQSHAEHLRFESQLNQALFKRAQAPLAFGPKLAFALLTIVIGYGVTQWTQSLQSPATITSTSEESFIALWTEEEMSLDDEALPDDYMLLSQLID